MRKANFRLSSNSKFYGETTQKSYMGAHKHNMSVQLPQKGDKKCNFKLGYSKPDYVTVAGKLI